MREREGSRHCAGPVTLCTRPHDRSMEGLNSHGFGHSAVPCVACLRRVRSACLCYALHERDKMSRLPMLEHGDTLKKCRLRNQKETHTAQDFHVESVFRSCWNSPATNL